MVKVGHKLWIYNPAAKPTVSKRLRCLCPRHFRQLQKITPVTFRILNEKDKEGDDKLWAYLQNEVILSIE